MEKLPTPGFFTAALGNDENANVFEASFAGGVDREEPLLAGPEMSTQPCDLLLPTMTTSGGLSPLFALSPGINSMPMLFAANARSNGMQYPGYCRDAQYWAGVRDGVQSAAGELPLVDHQTLSPPQLARSPPLFSFDNSQRVMSPRQGYLVNPQQHNISTSSHRSELGQITPPNSEENEQISSTYMSQPGAESSCDESLHVQMVTPTEISAMKSKKRARKQSRSGQSSNDADVSPAKRARKSTAKSKATSGDDEKTAAKADGDQKRTRFLERNRVAASKCRQKKKEWTTNIEVQARELQTDKNQLSLIVASLKEEVLWLKGELLKHTDCGCERIRQYLDQEAANLSSPKSVPHHHRLANSSTTSVQCSSHVTSPSSSSSGVTQVTRRGSELANTLTQVVTEPKVGNDGVNTNTPGMVYAELAVETAATSEMAHRS